MTARPPVARRDGSRITLEAVVALRERRRQKLLTGRLSREHYGHGQKVHGQKTKAFAVALLVGLSVWALVGTVSRHGAIADPDTGSRNSPGAGLDLISAGQLRTAQPNGRMVPVDNGCPLEAAVCVDTRLRLSWLQQNGKIVYGPIAVMPGSRGVDGSVPTPQGIFHVEWKDAQHQSNEYNEKMPDAVFFAPGGIAFHEGSLSSSSHGCVHLTGPDSDYYFAHLRVGDEVAVFGGENPPA